jgi:hypothetical protein
VSGDESVQESLAGRVSVVFRWLENALEEVDAVLGEVEVDVFDQAVDVRIRETLGLLDYFLVVSSCEDHFLGTHIIQDRTCAEYICFVRVTIPMEDLRRHVARSPALPGADLVWLQDLRHSEVSNIDLDWFCSSDNHDISRFNIFMDYLFLMEDVEPLKQFEHNYGDLFFGDNLSLFN